MLDLDDDNLEAEIETASSIAEYALDEAYNNRDCRELDSELERAFGAFREAADTIKSRVEALNIQEDINNKYIR